jgi:hypothetical protein
MVSIFYKSTEPLWEQRWHLHTPTSSWGNLKKLIIQSAPHKPLSWFHNVIFTGSVSIQKGDVISGCFMGEFYSRMSIVGMVKETIEVFFRLGPRTAMGTKMAPSYANIFMEKLEKTNHTICTPQATFLVSFHRRR